MWQAFKSWMPGIKPGMTRRESCAFVSLRLEIGILDDAEELVAFRLHERCELLDRRRLHVGARLEQPRLHVRLCQDLVDLGIEPHDDLSRRRARREEALPERDIEASNATRLGD